MISLNCICVCSVLLLPREMLSSQRQEVEICRNSGLRIVEEEGDGDGDGEGRGAEIEI